MVEEGVTGSPGTTGTTAEGVRGILPRVGVSPWHQPVRIERLTFVMVCLSDKSYKIPMGDYTVCP